MYEAYPNSPNYLIFLIAIQILFWVLHFNWLNLYSIFNSVSFKRNDEFIAIFLRIIWRLVVESKRFVDRLSFMTSLNCLSPVFMLFCFQLYYEITIDFDLIHSHFLKICNNSHFSLHLHFHWQLHHSFWLFWPSIHPCILINVVIDNFSNANLLVDDFFPLLLFYWSVGLTVLPIIIYLLIFTD